MARRIPRAPAALVVFSGMVVLGFVYGPVVVDTLTPDTRSELERLADQHSLPKVPGRHSLQIGMLTKYRALFEAAARNVPGKRKELIDRTRGCVWLKDGRFEYWWVFGSGHWSCVYRLIFCPNGERDLPDHFWEGGFNYTEPMKIDDHWFAAYEPSG